MSYTFRIPILAACLFTAAPAVAQDWGLDIQPGECTLNRAVMEPAPLLVSLWTRPGSQMHTLVIANRDLPDLRGKSATPVTIQFAQGGAETKGSGGSFPIRPEAGRGITVRGLNNGFLDSFGGAQSLTVTIGSKTYGPYAIPRSGGAIRAFKGCVADQLIEWGADPAQFKPGGKQPVPLASPDEWISGRQLVQVSDGGNTFQAVYRLSISPQGVVDGCARIDDAKDKGAEKRGCAIVMMQKIATPASDAQGNPVRGVLTFQVGLITRTVRVSN